MIESLHYLRRCAIADEHIALPLSRRVSNVVPKPEHFLLSTDSNIQTRSLTVRIGLEKQFHIS